MQRGRVLAVAVAASLCFGAVSLTSAVAVPAPALEHAISAQGLSGDTQGLVAGIRALGLRSPGSAPSASSTPIPAITVHDPAGDANFASGDITGVGVLQNASATTFAVTVKSPTNPRTDPNWASGAAFVGWYLDTNGNGLYENIIVMAVGKQSGQLLAAVADSTGNNILCGATPVYVAHSGYRVVVPAGCLPHLETARFGSCFFYSTDPNNQTANDCAPDHQLGPSTAVQEHLHDGYWMLGADGQVYAFGGAVDFGGTAAGAVAMAPRKDGKGYWVVDFAGHVFAYGTAGFFGGTPALGAGEFVSTISATPNAGGYWLFTNQGRAFAFGNAKSFGDMSGVALNGPIVASVATPTGKGYYMVGSDGGIFSFGDAHFHGSTGNIVLNKPVVGISPTPDGKGYWLVASDGGVFAFSAPFRGSMGGTTLNQPVDGLVAFGNGYLMAAADGGIFDFSNKQFFGSLAGSPPASPIIGLAAFSS